MMKFKRFIARGILDQPPRRDDDFRDLDYVSKTFQTLRHQFDFMFYGSFINHENHDYLYKHDTIRTLTELTILERIGFWNDIEYRFEQGELISVKDTHRLRGYLPDIPVFFCDKEFLERKLSFYNHDEQWKNHKLT